MTPLIFNADALPHPTHEYVAWIDIMGTQASMSRSIRATANFVYKLHSAALQAVQPTVRLYPVMDGIYATSESQPNFLAFLRQMMSALADTFIATAEMKHRFLARGGLAFGAVYHGASVGAAASPTLAGAPLHRDQILLGMPMVQAHLAEGRSPPFGLAVDESARGFAPASDEPLHTAWWHWKHHTTGAVWNALPAEMEKYFAWCSERSDGIGYSSERIAVHRTLFHQFVALAG